MTWINRLKLWGGIVGDDGPDGVQTGSDFPGSCFLQLQRQARQLADRRPEMYAPIVAPHQLTRPGQR